MTRLVLALFTAAAAALASPAAAEDAALSLVPPNAVTVGMVHLAEMRTSPLSGAVFEHVDAMSSAGEAGRFLLETGVRPFQDVDRLVVATAPRTNLGSEADVLVVAEGRFQPERLAAALVARGAVARGAYLLLDDPAEGDEGNRGAVAFLSPSLAVAGNERSVVNALAAHARGGTDFAARGALATELRRVDRLATAWALIDVPRAARLAGVGTVDTGSGQSGAALQAAMKSVSSVAFWARDTGEALQLGASGHSTDAETLRLVEDALRGALAAMRLMASEKAPEMVSVLRRFEVERDAGSVRVEGSIPAATLHALMATRLAEAMRR